MSIRVFAKNTVSFFFWSFETLGLLLMQRFSPPKTLSKRKTLVLIRTDAIGDFVLWSAMFGELENLFPKMQYEWILIGNSAFLELAQSSNQFDRILPLQVSQFQKNLLYRIKMLSELTRLRADVVFQPTYSRSLRIGDTLARAIRCSTKIAPEGDLCNSSRFESWLGRKTYSELVPTAVEPKMELLRNAEVLSHLAGKKISAKKPHLTFEEFTHPQPPYFVVFPGASWIKKEWGFSKFAALAKRIQGETGWTCVLAGSESEGTRFRPLLSEFRDVQYLDFFGKTSLPELARLISNAKLLVSNDTAAAHIGNNCNTPTVCILGGGHFKRFFPWLYETNAGIMSQGFPVYHEMPCFNCTTRSDGNLIQPDRTRAHSRKGRADVTNDLIVFTVG